MTGVAAGSTAAIATNDIEIGEVAGANRILMNQAGREVGPAWSQAVRPSAISIAFNRALALFIDSRYSLAGTESATMPAPACK